MIQDFFARDLAVGPVGIALCVWHSRPRLWSVQYPCGMIEHGKT